VSLRPYELDLSGTWAAAPADDALRRAATLAEFDDQAWTRVDVPGHWQRSTAFADEHGPLIFRRSFDQPAATSAPDGLNRWWLELDGVFSQADVWLDGTYLGDTEGYFVPHAFEVTEELSARSEHSVVVEVTSPVPADLRYKRVLTGEYQHSDSLDAERNPGGIWAPVRLSRSGRVRITHQKVTCTHASAVRAELRCQIAVDALSACDATVVTRIGALEQRRPLTLVAGENRTVWNVGIDHPVLWWPRALGEADLVDVHISVEVDGTTSDQLQLRTGLREVRMHAGVLRVNGERLFLKGANLLPTRHWPAEVSGEDVSRDLHLAERAGLDLLRIHAHIAHPTLYSQADERGMLLWQDLPLTRGYHRSVRRQAVRQARKAVELLGHHPSIAVWCGHDEPATLRTDRSIQRVLRRTDGSRPVVAHAGTMPTLDGARLRRAHWSLGWVRGSERALPALARIWPAQVRFVSQFGAQSIPADAPFLHHADWPGLDWDELRWRYGLETERLLRHVPTAEIDSAEEWASRTRRYQADLVRFHVETLRRLKYRPAGGFAVMSLIDVEERISQAVLSHRRIPKDAFVALSEVCRPVIAVADRLPAAVPAGLPLSIDVHVVSDLRIDHEAELCATWTWDGGSHRRCFAGTVAADSVAFVARLDVVPREPGPLRLDLTLSGSPVIRTDSTTVVAILDELGGDDRTHPAGHDRPEQDS
jgi:beta-mannosidase